MKVKFIFVPLLSAALVIVGLLNGCSQDTPIPSTEIDQGITPSSNGPPTLLQAAPATDDGVSVGLVLPVPQRINDEAERIINNVSVTSYQHTTEVDEDKGIYKVDCSGLADYVLKRVALENYQQIPHDGEPRPYAEHFYQFFKSLDYADSAPSGGWCQIRNLANAGPGDIIVYEYTEAYKKEKGTTGHVMIIQSKPVQQSNGEYIVWVIDSANSGHGSDTRTGSGVGKGKMWFGVDSNGCPVFYRWSRSDGEKHYEGLLGITIGRAG